jgi:hypothetical protein
MKRAANKTISTEFNAIEFYFKSNIYLGFFKFYQPKATGSGFLIFEWTLVVPTVKKHQRFILTLNTTGT